MYTTNCPFGGEDPVFDSEVCYQPQKPKADGAYVIPEQILDDASDDLAEKQIRANGMAAALTWMEDEDASYENFEAIVAGLADVDEDGEVTEPEEELFNDILNFAADALVELGANAENVQSFINDESEQAGEKLHAYLSEKLSSNEKSDDELITEYAVKAKLVLDATQRVIRDGKVKLIKKPLKKKRLSSAQRAALKKARRKANNSGARRKRAKSMKARRQRGM
ncbi:TPA: hypothetical protein ACMDRZ_003057 [Vibrio cholerae]|uniref:Tail tube protein (P1-like gp21) n=1 Tax=Vibrio vulnificus TaxID=672 RepID=A0AAI8ZLF3_VIBVL|nr:MULTISPECIES: hypothetical protein [Vibrio]EHU8077701.1 hypothetical protein [Vibrio cholerae]EHV9953757.1 hypothetical protein [Vibrio cholerae]EKF9218981.1 hypothetical protein [Vibrio cholerae]MEB5557063.1 hypothetical protein [Vibrio cholerae]OQK43768.1 hypothetical protein XM75_u0049 [Vibrio vulnificus]